MIKHIKYMLIILIWSIPTIGYSGECQIGIIAGSPIGISGTYWMTDNRGLSAHMGIMDDRLISLSHLWKFTEFHKSLQEYQKFMDYYYIGAGGAVKNGKGDRVGFVVPLGLAKDVTIFKLPLSISIEISPMYRLSPSFGFNADGGIRLEYRFN
ncbi:MAG: hypothetical protein ABII23_03515 [bacterium]